MSQGKQFEYAVPSLGGGLNLLSQDHLAENEGSVVENLYVVGDSLVRRPGSAKVTTVAHSEDLTSVFRFVPPLTSVMDQPRIIVGAKTGLLRVDGPTLVPIVDTLGRAFSPSLFPWILQQRDAVVLAARDGAGALKIVKDGAYMLDAGIPAPTAGPTITDGGAGAMAAGDYYPVVAFLDKTTGAISNYSPVGGKLTLGANKQITFNNVQVSPNVQVTSRVLGLTLPNRQGRYFKVPIASLGGAFQIDDNLSTGPFTVNAVLPDQAGAELTLKNSPPPAEQIIAVAIHAARAWIASTRYVWWSQNGLMQSYDLSRDLTAVSKDDGHDIEGLRAWEKQGLLIPKENGMWIMTGVGDEDFRLDSFSSDHGCPAALSIGTAEGVALWFTGANIAMSQGVGAIVAPGTEKLRPFLKRIPATRRPYVVGEVIPSKGWYVLSATLDSGEQNNGFLVYNYLTGSAETFVGNVPSFLRRFVSDGDDLIYGTLYDKLVYQMFTGDKDGSTNITARFRSKGFGSQRPGIERILRKVSVLTPPVNGNLTIRAYNDLNPTPVKQRTISLSGKGWKRAKVSTRGRPAAIHEIELEYSGQAELTIDQLLVEGNEFQRRGRVL